MGKEYHEEDEVSTSCISSEPNMQPQVSSSTLGAPTDEKIHLDQTEADERSLKLSIIKLTTMLVFMICSFVGIFVPGSPQFPLDFASLAALKMRIRVPEILPIVWNDLRTRVRIPRRVDKVYYGVGCLAVLVAGIVVYFSSRKKQSRGIVRPVQENAIEETPDEIVCGNDDVLKLSVSASSHPPEASMQNWKPISGLNVKLELEYSVGEMSSVEKMAPVETTQVFERKGRRKSMSTITHNVVKRDSSVGSSSSCDRSHSRECKAEAPLRRSIRIRNKIMSPPLTEAVTSRG